MGWSLLVGCECGGMLKDLAHRLNECSFLATGRPTLHMFFDRVSPDLLPGQMDIRDIIFSPSEVSVIELFPQYLNKKTILC